MTYNIDCPHCQFSIDACRADCDIERNTPVTDEIEASIKAEAITRWNTRTAPKVKPLESQTGLYEGDRILIEGNWGIQNICQVERFRDCLGVFMSDAHRKAGRFIPLSEMYGHGTGSKTGYIGNFGEYIENPVALWMQVPKDTPLTNEW